jgi:hypothetical protein
MTDKKINDIMQFEIRTLAKVSKKLEMRRRKMNKI